MALSPFCGAVMAGCAVAASPPPGDPIVIDAAFDDWRSVAPLVVDAADAPDAFIDLGEVRAVADGHFVHLLVDFGRTVNVQGLSGTAMLLLDADGLEHTGDEQHGLAGVDVIIDLTPPNASDPSRPGMGIGVRSMTYQPKADDPEAAPLSPYDIGFMFAPTHAGRRMEFRFERGATLPQTPALFTGDSFRGRIVALDASGSLVDATEPFSVALPAFDPHPWTPADPMLDPLTRAEGTAIRVVSWNARFGAIISNPEPFARVLAALDPDIVLLQEMTDRNSAEQIEIFFNAVPWRPAEQAAGAAETAREARWHAVFGAAGGDLRCAVAARCTVLQPLDFVAMPRQPDRFVRALGTIVECGDRRMLVVSAHLKCCGSAGGPEDATRSDESRAVNEAIQQYVREHGIDGLVIAGDLNLVGARDPIEMLAAGLDVDGSALAIAALPQLDGLSNATWRDRQQPFAPGRLDYALISDASLRIAGGFVFDSLDLAERWRQVHGIGAEDSDAASDHLPLVLDLAWYTERR